MTARCWPGAARAWGRPTLRPNNSTLAREGQLPPRFASAVGLPPAHPALLPSPLDLVNTHILLCVSPSSGVPQGPTGVPREQGTCGQTDPAAHPVPAPEELRGSGQVT